MVFEGSMDYMSSTAVILGYSTLIDRKIHDRTLPWVVPNTYFEEQENNLIQIFKRSIFLWNWSIVDVCQKN